MKKILDWESRAVATIFDEVTLWSAPFGRLLLENIPMKPGATVVDIGFGTGFPLIELSQRFGNKSKIYGIDIWKEGINRTKDKINTLEISNIEIFEESATKINIGDGQVDLVTSNLGVNNFEQRQAVYLEISRILKKGGRFCMTTNPIGTFEELFEIFSSIFREMNLIERSTKLEEYIQNRNTERTNIRFVDAIALLDHSLIRIGFREYWTTLVKEENAGRFFEKLILRINDIIETQGVFKMTIPMLYLEFEI